MLEKELVEKLKEFLKGFIPPPPVMGKVVRVYTNGGKAHFLNSLYSADVLFLELEEQTGAFRESELIIPDVPILTIGVGNSEGSFFLPEVGSIVKLLIKVQPLEDSPFSLSLVLEGFDEERIEVVVQTRGV